jgi:hypothetical protein
LFDSEFLPALVKNIPFFFTIFGAFFSLILIHCFGVSRIYVFDLKMLPVFRSIYVYLNKKWHIDQIFNELIAVKLMNFGYSASFKTIDKGLIEQFGPTGLSSVIYNYSFNLTAFNSGFIYHTIFTFVSCTVMYFVWYLFMSLGLFLSVNNAHFLICLFGLFLVSLAKKW